jgi:hypothetical protein
MPDCVHPEEVHHELAMRLPGLTPAEIEELTDCLFFPSTRAPPIGPLSKTVGSP